MLNVTEIDSRLKKVEGYINGLERWQKHIKHSLDHWGEWPSPNAKENDTRGWRRKVRYALDH